MFKQQKSIISKWIRISTLQQLPIMPTWFNIFLNKVIIISYALFLITVFYLFLFPDPSENFLSQSHFPAISIQNSTNIDIKIHSFFCRNESTRFDMRNLWRLQFLKIKLETNGNRRITNYSCLKSDYFFFFLFLYLSFFFFNCFTETLRWLVISFGIYFIHSLYFHWSISWQSLNEGFFGENQVYIEKSTEVIWRTRGYNWIIYLIHTVSS